LVSFEAGSMPARRGDHALVHARRSLNLSYELVAGEVVRDVLNTVVAPLNPAVVDQQDFPPGYRDRDTPVSQLTFSRD